MTMGGGARRGRRDNGLVAAAYAVAGDVDPRVGEHLLDVLAVRGIAAYLQPAADLHPVTRTTTLPSRPTDRLYVDRTHLDTARSFIAQLAPEGAQATAEPATIAAVIAILAGVLLLFDPGLLPMDNTAAMALGLGGILAGFIGLIWRLRSGDDDDDWDPDDGAVV